MKKDIGGRHPIRVCHIAPSLDMLGGQSIQAARLLEGLKEAAEVEAELLPINPTLPGPLRGLQRIKYVRTVVNTLATLILLIVRLPRYDIVQVYAASYFSFLLTPAPAVLLAKLYGKRVIMHYHSGEAQDHLSHWYWMAAPVIRLADVVITPSGYLVDVFERFGLRARAIFNIARPDEYRFRGRKPFRPVFFTNRLHEPLYNVPCVLRAFALIQRRYPEARLTVGGDGWQRPRLERLARDLKLRNTIFTGRIPSERMPAAYDAHDIYLTTPDIDNMPNSITECFAAGLPVVTTNAGGLPYIVRHEETGLMVECDDHEALAANAIRLLEDQELAAAIARRAREECARYEWSQVKGLWLAVFRALARPRKRREWDLWDRWDLRA
ncbi:MAG TPA: glycosyltransferase family 4 protein [Blastocatellia bacterium]|nr:glycosyltransferase family 4 protein [Blastocatellia bacterium]